MNLKTIVFFISVVVFGFTIQAQEIVPFHDLYVHNDLLYKTSNDSLFSGICERRRKNGHLVVQENIEKGIILTAKYYYNGKKKRISDSVTYNPNKPYKYKTIYRFNLLSQVSEIQSYDENGKLILKEEFEDGKLVYSCQYNGKKKHGLEFCYSNDGERIEIQYIEGKKIKPKD